MSTITSNTNVSVAPSQEAVSDKARLLGGMGPAGARAVIAMLSEKVKSIQYYNEQIMALSAVVLTLHSRLVKGWLDRLNQDHDAIQKVIDTPLSHYSDDDNKAQQKKNNYIQKLTNEYQIDNSLYNQSNEFWSAITALLNRVSTDTNNTISTDLKINGRLLQTMMNLASYL